MLIEHSAHALAVKAFHEVSSSLKQLICPHTHTNHSTPAAHARGNYKCCIRGERNHLTLDTSYMKRSTLNAFCVAKIL